MKRLIKKIFTILMMSMMAFSLSAKSKKTIVKKIKKTPQVFRNMIPESIITLYPEAAEIILDLGAEDQLTGVLEYSGYSPELAKKPVVTVNGENGPTIDDIKKLKPECVILKQGMFDYLVPQLEEYGIECLVSKANSIDTLQEEIYEFGRIAVKAAESVSLAQSMKEKIQAIKPIEFEEGELSVYFEVSASPYITAGAASITNDIIETAGGKNIFADKEQDFCEVTAEEIIERAPYVILIAKASGITAEDIKAREGWSEIPAVQDDRIFIVDDSSYTRLTPDCADAAYELYELLK